MELPYLGFGYYGHPVEAQWKNTDNDPFSAGGNISIWYRLTCSLSGISVKKR